MKGLLKENTILNVIFAIILSILSVILAKHLSGFKPEDMASQVRRFQAIKYNGKTYGTGFNLEYRGKFYVITNMHVCEVSKQLGHAREAVVNGEVLRIIKISDKHDLCALESNTKSGFKLAKESARPLDDIILMGHPRGLDLIIRRGQVVTEDFTICVDYGYQGVLCRPSDRISALAYGGNSGSPILNTKGNVVGVLYAGANAYPHEPFIVPFEYLKEFLIELDMQL